MTAASSLNDADIVPIVQIGTNKKSALSLLKTYVLNLLTFLDLTDVPSSYSGEGGKLVAVKSDVSGLEFVTVNAPCGFSLGRASGLVVGKVKGFITVPRARTIVAYNFVVDTGGVTVKVWKRATGTAKPTSADSINTSGVLISSGTALRSTDLSDFTTTTIAANDLLAFEITGVSGTPTEVMFVLELA